MHAWANRPLRPGRPLRIVLTVCAVVGAVMTLMIPTAHAAVTCDPNETQPFLPWLDPNYYVLIPGGALESGSTDWGLAGGADIVQGNEPFHVHSSYDNQSLYLPSGSSARTGKVCMKLTTPTLRFFAVNTGSPTSTLTVQVFFHDALGTLLGSATIADLSATGSWEPMVPVAVLANVATPTGTDYVRFRFAPAGLGSEWRIDDVYLDPWISR
jgi:hypothetical protein